MANKIQSPLATLLPSISAEEAASMAYPPDAMPGARDVETFYGSMRVYEWGPAGGEKILFVHGDATPSLVFSKIAQGLVDAGYRVMLFGELCRRGYEHIHPDNDFEPTKLTSQLITRSLGSGVQRYTTRLSARRSSVCITNTPGAHILATFLDGKRHEVFSRRLFPGSSHLVRVCRCLPLISSVLRASRPGRSYPQAAGWL